MDVRSSVGKCKMFRIFSDTQCPLCSICLILEIIWMSKIYFNLSGMLSWLRSIKLSWSSSNYCGALDIVSDHQLSVVIRNIRPRMIVLILILA